MCFERSRYWKRIREEPRRVQRMEVWKLRRLSFCACQASVNGCAREGGVAVAVREPARDRDVHRLG